MDTMLPEIFWILNKGKISACCGRISDMKKEMQNKNKLNIAVLYGGTSSERDISLLSGKNVADALSLRGHNVTLIDTKAKSQLKILLDKQFDIAFNALHGKGGEDGVIQGFLETVGIKYTGSKIQASVKSMNKADTKIIFNAHNIPNAPFFIVKQGEDFDIEEGIKATGQDVVVKAASEGSSIGLYFANGKDEIIKAINKALEFDNAVVVETRIKGREFTCAVIEFSDFKKDEYQNSLIFKNNISVLPVIEIVPKNEFYDFESKYEEGGSKHICPAHIDDSTTKEIQKVAYRAHKILGCSGFSRTDMIVDKKGQVFALETNNIPGMTNKSLVPDAARAVGISFEELCELLVLNELTS